MHGLYSKPPSTSLNAHISETPEPGWNYPYTNRNEWNCDELFWLYERQLLSKSDIE